MYRRRKPIQSERPRLVPEVRAGINAEACAFKRRFGRLPDNDDPVIFDRDAPTLKSLTGRALLHHLLGLAGTTGLSAPRIYAHHKLFRQIGYGFDRNLWNQAILEYYFYADQTRQTETVAV